MRRTSIREALVVVAALTALVAPATGGDGATGDAVAGKKVFGENCTACHSASTTQRNAGPGLKDLYKGKKLPGSGKPVTDANVRKQILKGGRGMPGFEGTLNATEIDDVIAYLKTL